RSAGGGQVLARLWRVGRSSFKTTPYGLYVTMRNYWIPAFAGMTHGAGMTVKGYIRVLRDHQF
ncbi:MAG: hypothetical protein ACNYWU_13720, partial [Desulfobacterales bacterium]